MNPTSLADRLLSIYVAIGNARSSLKLAHQRKDPENTQCQRVHDVIRIADEVTLYNAAEQITELIKDLKGWEYMQLRGTTPDGAEGWVK